MKLSAAGSGRLHIRKLWRTIILSCGFVLSSCVGPDPSPTMLSIVDDASPTVSSSTPNARMLTSTFVPSATSLPTQNTFVITPTARPTLTVSEATATILELLQDNGGCRPPCWWGINPGVTAWSSAEMLFTDLGTVPEPYRDRFYVYTDIPMHSIQITQVYTVIDGVIDRINIYGSTTKQEDGFRVFGDAEFKAAWRQYLLPQILSDYGVPKEVLMTTISVAAEESSAGHLPFYLLLFYPENGMLVEYEGWNQQSGSTLLICPQNTDVTLGLWSGASELTLEEVASLNFGELTSETLSEFRRLNEATALHVNGFYELYVGGDISACVETLAALWPP